MPMLVLAGIGAVILAVLNPRLILEANTPSGGDMAAHVAVPAFLRDVLLPEGRILGWSMDWFAGYPVFYFYFPLPSLVIVALDVFLPYGVAFKLVTVLGLLATPPAVYFLARSLRFGRAVATVTAGAGAAFIFMESFTIYGGNVLSTLAGEFSFSWSFALCLVYLGLLIKAVRDHPRYQIPAALALAAAVLCHIITTIVIVFASLTVLTWRGAWRRAVPIWLGGFSIAGFWVLPLLARLGFSSDMAWVPLRAWEEVFPLEIWLLIPPAIAGAIWTWKRTPRVLPVVALTLTPIIYYPLPNVLPELFPGIFNARWKLWNGRLLPFWYFGVTFFAAVALGAGAMWLARRLPERMSGLVPRITGLVAGVVAVVLLATEPNVPTRVPWALGLAMGGALLLSMLWYRPVDTKSFLSIGGAGIIALGALAGITIMNGWARWNYTGYEGKPRWPEYQALMETAGTELAPGRIHWEYDRTMNDFGSPMALMLFPYWTEDALGSMEGLFFESSLSTPFHFLNQAEMSVNPSSPIPGLDYHRFDFERGIRHLQMFGVRYYVTYTPEAMAEADKWPELTELTTTGPFTFYEVADAPLVEVANYQPAVYEGPHNNLLARLGGVVGIGPDDGTATFEEVSLDWYGRLDLLDRWIATDGPEEWPRVSSLDELTRVDRYPAAEASVTGVVMEDDLISFRTSAVGVPHLIKVSYFPNWRATGAEGPFHAGPSFMIVVPTEEQVTLRFANTVVENIGWLLTILGLAVAAAGTVWYKTRRRVR
ncbi:MAG: hypothetical protein ACRDWH_08805 [Acidimicrobiia bacterium]